MSDKLARSGGVICPPKNVDPEIKQPTPPGGNACNPATRDPRRGPVGTAEVTAIEWFGDTCLTVFTAPPYIALVRALFRNGGVAQLVRAAES
jgi:hypothetical protein